MTYHVDKFLYYIEAFSIAARLLLLYHTQYLLEGYFRYGHSCQQSQTHVFLLRLI